MSLIETFEPHLWIELAKWLTCEAYSCLLYSSKLIRLRLEPFELNFVYKCDLELNLHINKCQIYMWKFAKKMATNQKLFDSIKLAEKLFFKKSLLSMSFQNFYLDLHNLKLKHILKMTHRRILNHWYLWENINPINPINSIDGYKINVDYDIYLNLQTFYILLQKLLYDKRDISYWMTKKLTKSINQFITDKEKKHLKYKNMKQMKKELDDVFL